MKLIIVILFYVNSANKMSQGKHSIHVLIIHPITCHVFSQKALCNFEAY